MTNGERATWVVLIALLCSLGLAVAARAEPMGDAVTVQHPVAFLAQRAARQISANLLQHWQIEPYATGDLTDWDNTGRADGDVPTWNATAGRWVPDSVSGASNWQRASTVLSPLVANDTVEIESDSDGAALLHINGSGDAYSLEVFANHGVAGYFDLFDDSPGGNTDYSVFAADRAYLGEYWDTDILGTPPPEPETGNGRWYSGTDNKPHFLQSAAAGGADFDLTDTGATTLDALTDVTITAAADNEFLRYDSGTSQWVDEAVTIPADISGLTYITGVAEAALSNETRLYSALGMGDGMVTQGPPGAAPPYMTIATTNPWTLVPKTADETLGNDTTVNNDTHLTFGYASGYYAFRIRVYFTTTAAGDFKFANTWSANLTRTNMTYKHIIPGTAAGTAALFSGNLVASGTAISMAGTGTTGGYIEIDGAFNASGAGTFNFQWSKNGADAGTTTVHAGSYLEWRKVN